MILPLKQLNYLKEFWFDPCDAPLTIYAATFFPAFLQLVLTYFALDLKNILFNATKPTKALGKRRSGKKGRNGSKARSRQSRWRYLNPLNFDQDELIGKGIRGTTNFASRTIGTLEFRLWLVYGVLERVGYGLFLLNLVTDFFYNWMSLTEQSQFCIQQRARIVMRKGDDQIMIGGVGWQAWRAPDVLKQRGLSSSLSSVSAPGNSWLKVFAGGSVQPLGDNPVTFKLRIRSHDFSLLKEVEMTTEAGKGGELALEYEIRGPRSVLIEVNINGTSTCQTTFGAYGSPGSFPLG